MTAPIQPSASTPSAMRGAKSPAATTGLPFNAVLTQEVAQRSAEPPPVQARSAVRTPQSGQSPKAADKVSSPEKDVKDDAEPMAGATAAAPPEILALAADISQLTGKLPATDVPSNAITDTGAKLGKHETFSLGKLELSDSAAAMIEPDVLDAAHPKDGAGAKGQGFAAALLRSAPSGVESGVGDLRAQDGLSASSPSSLNTIVPMQQASASFAAQAAVPASDKLTPPVGTPVWDQALGNKVVWMAGTAVQTASLSLNPPDLGPLQVVLSVSNSQATATFSAAQPEVRQALEAAMPRLRDMMQEAGIQLGEATVDAGSSNRQEMGDRGAQPGSRKPAGSGMPGGVEVAGSVARQQPVMRGQGLVDTFA